MEIKLTILIPTYNRIDQLKKVLTILQQQTNKNFFLVISDNSSNYNFDLVKEFVCEDLKKRTTFIKRKFNVGADINIFELFQFCNTTWAWTLSDDDIIQIDSVEKIINNVEKFPSVGCFNFSIVPSLKINKPILVSSIDEFVDLNKRYLCHHGDLIFLSNKVYNIDVAGCFLTNAYKYIYTRISSVVFLAKMLESNVPYMILTDRIVTYNDSSPRSWNLFEVILASRTLSDVPFNNLNNKQKRDLLRCLSFCISYVYYLYFVECPKKPNIPHFFDQIYHGLYKYILSYDEVLFFYFVKYISSFELGYKVLKKFFVWKNSDTMTKRILKKIFGK